MEYLLHVVKVNHAFDNIKQYLDLLKWCKLLLLFVELVEETSIL